MTRQKLIVGAVAAAFALSVAPVWAQGRPNTTGSSSGSAAPRGGEGGSSSAGSTSSGSGGSSGGSSMGSSMPGSMGSGGYGAVRERAPQHPNAVDRRGGGDSPQRAMPRGGATGGDPSRTMYGGAGTNNSVYAPERSGDRNAVPTYSRPRNGAPVVGQAVERRGTVPGQGGTYYPIYDPYYYYGYYDPYYGYGYRSSGYWLPGYGFGLGYFGYDPYLFGGYDDPYYYYSQGGSGSYGYGRDQGTGGVRLKVKPENAQVYVDGYYVGVTDSFDGIFQKLSIEAGPHRIEVRAEGYEPVQFDVMVTPGETVTYKGELKPIR